MSLLTFLVGGLWGGGLVLAGYFLGSFVPNIGQRIHWVIAFVVILSLLPAFIGAMRAPAEYPNRKLCRLTPPRVIVSKGI